MKNVDTGHYLVCRNPACNVIVLGGDTPFCPACSGTTIRVRASWIAVNLYEVAMKHKVTQ